MWVIKRYPVFKAFLDILEHWEVVQIVQDTLRDVLKKLAGERPGDPTKLCGRARKKLSPTQFLKKLSVFGIVWTILRWVWPTHTEK